MKRILKCQHCGVEFERARNDAKWCDRCRKAGMHEGASLVCPDCGSYKWADAKRCHTCENRIKWGRRGEKNQNWRGGRTLSEGYILIRVGAGKDAKYIYEHRLVWEKAHGPIPEGHIIHHLNGIKNDNRLENLAALPRNAHSGSAVLNVFKTRIRQLETQARELATV